MSVKIMARVWAHSQRKDGELLVMLALADFSNDAGECWPALDVLAQKARLSKKQLCKVLNKLEASGEIRRVRSSGGRNRRTRYFVNPTPDNSHQKTVLKGNGYQKTVFFEGENSPVEVTRNKPSGTVSSGAVRKRRESAAPPDPGVKTLLTAFIEKYQAAVGTPYIVITGKDPALLKRLLASHDLESIQAVMDRYFADPFYRKTGFDVGGFAKAFNRLNSAGAKNRPKYEADFPL